MSSRVEVLKLFLSEREDPVPFHEHLARRAVEELQFPLDGRIVVDLGCGPGHYTRSLRRAGAIVVPIDLDPGEFELPGGPPGDQIVANGMELPIPDSTVDGLFTSNMIEHTPDANRVISEAARVVRPGGWLWLSWTNWYSPWGGHDMSPYHYLGPRLGMRVRNRLGREEPKNYPLRSLFPLHIGPTIRHLQQGSEFEIDDVLPRYYPSQRWITRVPGLREVITWNCLITARRTGAVAGSSEVSVPTREPIRATG